MSEKELKFALAGCSQSYGEGLALNINDPDHFMNIVGARSNATINNIAARGNDNATIFVTALEQILYGNQDVMFIQWTSFDRYWLYPAPHFSLNLAPHMISDYKYNDLYLSRKYLQKLADSFFPLRHGFQSILEVIKYCNILEKVADTRCKVAFINGLLPWQPDTFDASISNYAAECSEYTIDMLDLKSRSDEEFAALREELIQSFETMNKDLWVNLFKNFLDVKVDDYNNHPGVLSNKAIADMIQNHISNMNVI